MKLYGNDWVAYRQIERADEGGDNSINYEIKTKFDDEWSRVYFDGDTPFIIYKTKEKSMVIDIVDPILVSIVRKG